MKLQNPQPSRLLFRSFLGAFWVICALAEQTFGQSRQVPGPPQSQPIIIHATTIHTVNEGNDVIDSGYVVFDKGLIAAVGAGSPPQVAGAIALNGEGLHVYPGLIAADTTLGLSEVGQVQVTIDTTELGRVKPEVRAAVAVNPDSDLIPVARANGILTALVMPESGLISGRASILRLDGWTWEDMTITPDAGLVVNWPMTEPITAWWMERSEEDQRREIKEDLEAVEKVFDDALAYIKARDHDEKITTDLRYEAMRATLQSGRPILVSANLVGQIESAVAWAARRNLKIIIFGGAQADKAAALLKQHDIPVIIAGTHRLPTRRHDDYDAPYTLANKLHEAGVRFCIANGGEPAHERNLNHMAATAAAYGLPKEEALRAVTRYPAEILGLGETHGSLEPNKAATIIVTNGDPLEITTDTLVAFIDGRRIDLGTRQKSLNEKYREKYRQLGMLP